MVIQMIRLLRRIRRDELPEGATYSDDGCEVAEHCTSCPLAVCRYETPGGIRAIRNAVRDSQIVALARDGVPVDAIAERFRLSRRTVFRIVAETQHGASGKAVIRA